MISPETTNIASSDSLTQPAKNLLPCDISRAACSVSAQPGQTGRTNLILMLGTPNVTDTGRKLIEVGATGWLSALLGLLTPLLRRSHQGFLAPNSYNQRTLTTIVCLDQPVCCVVLPQPRRLLASLHSPLTLPQSHQAVRAYRISPATVTQPQDTARTAALTGTGDPWRQAD